MRVSGRLRFAAYVLQVGRVLIVDGGMEGWRDGVMGGEWEGKDGDGDGDGMGMG